MKYLSLIILGICAVSHAEPKKISEMDVIEMVLTSGFQAQIAKEEAEMVKADIFSAKAPFDAELSADISHSIDKREKISTTIFGSRTDKTSSSVGLSKKWGIGTKTGVKFLNERQKISGSPFFSANPTYESIWEFSLNQPLLKNFGGFNDRKNLAVARKNALSADLSAKRKIVETIHSAILQYWRWNLARDNLKISKEGVLAAKRFLNTGYKKKELGMIEESDIVAEKAHLKAMEASAGSAEISLSAEEAEFKTILGLTPEKELLPAEKEPSFKIAEDVAILAFKNRSDWLMSVEKLETKKITLKMVENKKLPEIDLEGSMQLNDISGTGFKNSFHTDSPNITVGMNFSFPLWQRQARGEEGRVRHEKAKELLSQKALEVAIKNEVAHVVKNARTAKEKLEQMKEMKKLQYTKWRLEEEKYKLGRSSVDTVIRYQEDYLSSQRELIDARFEHAKAVADYKLATESFLE